MSKHPGAGRLITGIAWAVLLLGLWLWGRGATDVSLSGPATGDAAAVGRPFGAELPAAHKPVKGAKPQRVDVAALRIQAPVVARGLDGGGAVDPPPYDQAGVVGWYGGGARPGERGTSLFVGHVDTETRPAVFYHLSEAKPGDTVKVVRDDGSIASFTVDEVEVYDRKHFDPARAYGPHDPSRAELRLITCGGTFDKASRTYTANVVVSAYLSGVEQPARRAG
ncbi:MULTISPECIES: class F sortase [unclassified Streptomyces]|uniref:class F sortase n=1 Tax=unclassified Streptomyces TaxID=2593676 RepID=UPI000DB96852|nr:class F sortase [Streptomyces sp. PsTaAH-137]MYT71506.1 class F sortase [Streptomyces sp. SID8367]RAJ82969.1 sortase family protein [Streptomyces sp. PsTaAH-137]